MFFARCCLQRGRPVLLSAGSANFRRFLQSPGQNLSALPRIVVERANYYIEHWAAHAIRRYFIETVLKEDVPHEVRVEAGEAVIDLLLRKRCFNEAFSISGVMLGQRAKLSAPLRAKTLSVRLVFGVVEEKTYYHNLEGLLGDGKFKEEDGERHFLDVLQFLGLAEKPAERLERVVQMYLNVRDKNYKLGSLIIAFMIKSHMEEARGADAERWLSYHSLRRTPSNVQDDPYFCYPYTAFVYGRLLASPDKDARKVYRLTLDRMAKDKAWPDAGFINVLISADLKQDHYRSALELYDLLREHVSRGVYPDETTYAQLFAAAAHVITIPFKKTRAQWTVPPRVLYREMCEIQLHIRQGNLPSINPVVTKKSLGAALECFIAREDYAAAIIVLKTFEFMRVPLEQRIIDIVIRSIVSRCRRDLEGELEGEIKEQERLSRRRGRPKKPVERVEGRSWAQIFLDLRNVPKTKIRRLGERELWRRVLSVTRRALVISEREFETSMEAVRAMAEEEEESRGGQEEVEKGVKQADETEGSRHSREQQLESNALHESESESEGERPVETGPVYTALETDLEVETEPDVIHVRDQKKNTIREYRFRLIDVMLSRALETSVLLDGGYLEKMRTRYDTGIGVGEGEGEGSNGPRAFAKPAFERVVVAAEEMIPPVTGLTRSALRKMQKPRPPPPGVRTPKSKIKMWKPRRQGKSKAKSKTNSGSGS